MASNKAREKRRAARLRAVEKDKQEEILDQRVEDEVPVEQAEVVSKEYDSPGYYPISYTGPTSWDELDALKAAHEKAEAVQEVTWQVRDLVDNVLYSSMSPKEKAKAIQNVGDGFAGRVQMVEGEDGIVEKSIDTDLLELEVLIAKDNRHTSIIEKAGDFVTKVSFTAVAENKLSDTDFALVEEAEGKKVRKYPTHTKAHIRKSLADIIQVMKASGEAAVIVKNAIPNLRAAAKKAGIGQMEKSSSAVLVEKDLSGNWRAVMWPTNNFKDLDGEIISEAAHEEYVDWVNKNMDLAPVFTTWHESALVRKHAADFIGYENGFLVASAPLEQDEAVALLKAQLVTDIGMSHGSFALERDPQNSKIITKYRMVEMSDLPLENAANPFTDFETLISKEADMNIKDYLASMLGPEKAEAFMDKTNMKQKALREAGIEEKAVKTDAQPDPAPTATSDTPAPAPKMDIDAILKAVRTDLDVDGLNEFLSKAGEAMEKVPVLEAVIKELSAAKEEELAQMISPKSSTALIWQKSRATESKNNVVNEDDEADAKLKKSAPEVPWLNQVTGTNPL